jgi:hypothetical protein
MSITYIVAKAGHPVVVTAAPFVVSSVRPTDAEDRSTCPPRSFSWNASTR